MDETSILEKLIIFGLTRQEASIYLCLLKKGGLTGYEVSKQTGISRSNVYGGLSGLTDKGAAYLMEGAANKYVAVPIEEFCSNKIRRMNEEKEFLIKNMPSMETAFDGYITIEGAKNISDRIRNMFEKAEQRIYISAPEIFIKSISAEVGQAVKRNIKVVLITDKKTDAAGAKQYLSERKENQIRLIIDSEYVLTGDIGGASTDTCLYSGQQNFVNVFKEALHNEIKLIELTKIGNVKSADSGQTEVEYERN